MTGFSLLQYDGEDQSINRDHRDSNGLDLTYNNGNAFNVTFETDEIDSTLEIGFYVYDINGGVCMYYLDNVGIYFNSETAQIPFQMFKGNCNFQQVGALEFYFLANGSIDILIQIICR